MQAIPYVFFPNNTCREAMTAYARIFGTAPAEMMPYSQMPPGSGGNMDPAKIPDHAVMHAELDLGAGGLLYGSDDPSGETPAMAGCNIYLSFPTLARAREVFAALTEGGEVRMKLEPTFWSPGFGAGSDKWGTRWMISVDAPEAA